MHTLRLVSYDRGYRNLKDDFETFETEGLCIASQDNKVSVVKTFTENLKRLPEGFKSLQRLRRQLFKEFQPDCVITDFEPMTAYLANHYSLPLVTIDTSTACATEGMSGPRGRPWRTHGKDISVRWCRARTFRWSRCLPWRDEERSHVLSADLRREVRSLHLRRAITSSFIRRAALKLPRRVEGLAPRAVPGLRYDRSEARGPLAFKPFSREGFLRDLAAAKSGDCDRRLHA